MATAADLRGEGNDGTGGGIGRVAGVGTAGAVAIFALNAQELWRGLFVFEAVGESVANSMTGEASAVFVLVNGFEGIEGAGVGGF